MEPCFFRLARGGIGGEIVEIGVNTLHLTSYKKRTDYADYAVSRRPQDHRCVKKALPPVSPSLCSLCLWMCALPFWISTGNGATTRCVPVAAISSESVRPVSRNRRLTRAPGLMSACRRDGVFATAVENVGQTADGRAVWILHLFGTDGDSLGQFAPVQRLIVVGQQQGRGSTLDT